MRADRHKRNSAFTMGIVALLMAIPVLFSFLTYGREKPASDAPEASARNASQETSIEKNPLKVLGLAIGSTDMNRAVDMYSDILGFKVTGAGGSDGSSVTMQNGSLKLVLHKVENSSQTDPNTDALVYMNVQIDNLEESLRMLGEQGLSLSSKPRETPIGIFAAFKDPAGNVQQIVEQRPKPAEEISPAVFNIAIKVTDMDQALDFYCQKLGLEVMWPDHPPPIIPLKRHGAAPLILFKAAERGVKINYRRTAQTSVLFGADDLQAAVDTLSGRGIDFLPGTTAMTWAFEDPFGNVHGLIASEDAVF